jgi:hypothetical protein
MFEVYKLSKIPVAGNSHSVCRIEKWRHVLDSNWHTLEAAENFVVQKNFRFCAYDLGLSAFDPDDVVRHRCLYDKKREHKRQYFVGTPDVENIKKLLREDGIKVE